MGKISEILNVKRMFISHDKLHGQSTDEIKSLAEQIGSRRNGIGIRPFRDERSDEIQGRSRNGGGMEAFWMARGKPDDGRDS